MSKKRAAETLGIPQLYRMFPDESSCYAWLEDTRWHGDPVYPHCGSFDYIKPPPPSKPHVYWYKGCREHFTLTTGTCMRSTKKPLQDWIFAICSVLTTRKGVGAKQLSKEHGCQYRTEWHMLHCVRGVCTGGDFTRDRIAEEDETNIGGKERNKHDAKKLKQGWGTVGKNAVVGARERGGNVTARPFKRSDSQTPLGFIETHAEQGSTIYTGDAMVYGTLVTIFNQYQHETVSHGADVYVQGEVHTNSIESVWAPLKRSITRMWHHVSKKHLAHYVNEATFRLNEDNCQVDTLDRMAALTGGIRGKRLQYQDLVA